MASKSSRRNFVTASAAVAATPLSGAQPTVSNAEAARAFISAWDTAWANHDAKALGSLHAQDAITVNRFGTVVNGRDATQQALSYLHQNNGPFSHSSVPRQQIFSVQQVAQEVMIIHTKWQSPVMNPDGKIDPTRTDKLIVTFVIQKAGSEWEAISVDLHNVEKMDLPFSNPGQHP